MCAQALATQLLSKLSSQRTDRFAEVLDFLLVECDDCVDRFAVSGELGARNVQRDVG